jgi:hypothetical protein
MPSTTRTTPWRSSTTRSACASRASTPPRAGRSSSSSSTTRSSDTPSRWSPSASASSTPRSRSSTSSSGPPTRSCASTSARASLTRGCTSSTASPEPAPSSPGCCSSGSSSQRTWPASTHHELHANEILLLAYYIAAVNIETTYQDLRGELGDPGDYEPFPGLILTDTFQSWEDGDTLDTHRLRPEQRAPRAAQGSAHPGHRRQPALLRGAGLRQRRQRQRVLPDPRRRNRANLRSSQHRGDQGRSLYDSYIRAIKWASLRISDRGVIAFVTNGGWLDSNTADGMRLSLADEFSDIHVLNLRGNQRTAGEQSRRKEGWQGLRRRLPRYCRHHHPRQGPGPLRASAIHYTDIGDYLIREDKLAKLAAAGSHRGLEPRAVTTNSHGDWLTHRNIKFTFFLPIAERESDAGIFARSSLGLGTNRDVWVYNSGRPALARAMRRSVQFFARWRYEKVGADEGMLAFDAADDGEVIDGYRRIDNITDHALDELRCGIRGFDHQGRHLLLRLRAAALPRLPRDLRGRPQEDAPPHPARDRPVALRRGRPPTVRAAPRLRDGRPLSPCGTGRSGADRRQRHTTSSASRRWLRQGPRPREPRSSCPTSSTVVYNSRITLSGIPQEAYRYQLGSRSAIEWIIDRYQVKTDKASGIVNDPNDWSREVGDPRYIIDLLARIVTVSLETMTIVDALPDLDIRADT